MTRAAVVAAARFLTLEFPYRIAYFVENGRMNNWQDGRRYVDGEGRYYHIGLYLDESKYETLDPEGIYQGPAMWGEPLMLAIRGQGIPAWRKYPNGLDCSGFVSWACLNAGWDVGDSGAGDYPETDDDLCDLGVRVDITPELMSSGTVKPGDFIGTDGHIGIIAAIDSEYIWIADSFGEGVKMSRLRIEDELMQSYLFTYICLMDSYYGGAEGVIAAMW